jgi:REP element-mobilizing transposase RayT
MANTFTQILYHVVFSTKERVSALKESHREKLFRYIWGIHQNLDCHLYRINGMEDHVHILMSLHPSVSLADYVLKIKTSATRWIRRERMYQQFPGWQDGYGAFTLALHDKHAVIDYIKDQQKHHAKMSFIEEYRKLLTEAGVAYDEKYLA